MGTGIISPAPCLLPYRISSLASVSSSDEVGLFQPLQYCWLLQLANSNAVITKKLRYILLLVLLMVFVRKCAPMFH